MYNKLSKNYEYVQPNKEAPKYRKQKLTELKGKTDNSAIII